MEWRNLVVLFILVNLVFCDVKKKDIRDYNDADIEKLYDEWEENDDDKLPIPDDELPPHLQKPPPMNINDLKNKNKEDMMKLSKKGKSMMIFVTLSGSPTRAESEKITTLWQTSLFNANFEIQRFMVEDNRAIFMVNDGSVSWDIKDFLVKQDRCEEVSIDNEIFDGKGRLDAKKAAKSDL